MGNVGLPTRETAFIHQNIRIPGTTKPCRLSLKGELFIYLKVVSEGPLPERYGFKPARSAGGSVPCTQKTQPEKSRTALIAKVSQSAAAVVFHPPLAVGRCPVTRFCRPLAYKVRGHDIRESTSGLLLYKCRRKYRRLAHTPGHLTQRKTRWLLELLYQPPRAAVNGFSVIFA